MVNGRTEPSWKLPWNGIFFYGVVLLLVLNFQYASQVDSKCMLVLVFVIIDFFFVCFLRMMFAIGKIYYFKVLCFLVSRLILESFALRYDCCDRFRNCVTLP